MRYLIILFLFFAVPCFALKEVKIGIVLDGLEEEQDLHFKSVKNELTDLLEDQYNIEYKIFADSWDLLESRKTLFEALQDPTVDMVITLGVLSSYLALEEKNLKKPIVIGVDTQFILEDSQRPRNPLIAYYRGRKSLAPEVERFEEIAHSMKVAVIGDESLIGLPEFPIIREKITDAYEKMGVIPVFIPATEEPIPIIESIEVSDVDSVLLLPTWRLSNRDTEYLIEGINLLKLPSFSILGEQELQMGALMTMTPSAEMMRSARRIALNTQEMLIEGNSEDIEIAFFRANELIINESTAKAIGIDIPWSLLGSARMVEKIRPREIDRLNLWNSIDEAVRENLDLQSERLFVKVGHQDVLRSLSRLLPQMNLDVRARIVDQNTARFAFGNAPEKLVRGTISVEQRLYDERRFADHSIQSHNQHSREFEENAFELDITLNTAVVYLVVLRVQAEKEIAEENLALTKANLKRAHELVQSGVAKLSEVYRWESELSRNLEQLVSIQARLENVETEFNRLLNRPLKSRVLLKDMSPFNKEFVLDFGSLSKIVDSPRKFSVYKEFMIGIARENSPSIKSVDQRILASARELTASERAYYLPTLTAFGEFSNNVFRGGAGDRPPPGLSNAKMETAVGINLSFPLFTGGKRQADKHRAVFELSRLQTEKGSLVEKTDESVIRTIDLMKASYENIFHAKKAKEAGEKNLTIVTNSYVRGVISIVDLLDAQNNAIVSKQNFSNAIYDYLIDFMGFQRSISQFDHFLTQDEQKEILHNLMDWIEKS